MAQIIRQRVCLISREESNNQIHNYNISMGFMSRVCKEEEFPDTKESKYPS